MPCKAKVNSLRFTIVHYLAETVHINAKVFLIHLKMSMKNYLLINSKILDNTLPILCLKFPTFCLYLGVLKIVT